MPRTALEPRFQVEHLSILDSEGNLDAALEPKLSDRDLRSVYRAMLLGRRLDERMVRLQRQGRIGTFAPIKGQEASQLGSAFTLRRSDWMVPSFRETAAMVWRGWPIEKLLLFFSGHLEGGQPALEQHNLPITIPVATQLPHAVGLAYAAQYRGVDAASREAVERARAGDGPTLIECVTYRLGVHTTADDPTKYRTDQEVAMWEQKDPLTRFRAYLEKRNLLEEGLEQQVDEEIAEAVRRFETAPAADPLAMFDHVYAELTPELTAQRDEMAARERATPSDTGDAGTTPPGATPMRGQRLTRR